MVARECPAPRALQARRALPGLLERMAERATRAIPKPAGVAMEEMEEMVARVEREATEGPVATAQVALGER